MSQQSLKVYLLRSDELYSLDLWKQTRVSRLLIDYLIRKGFYDTAEQLTNVPMLRDLIDLRPFQEMKSLEASIRRKDFDPVFAWYSKHEQRLKKMGSTLKYRLHLHIFIEVCLMFAPKQKWICMISLYRLMHFFANTHFVFNLECEFLVSAKRLIKHTWWRKHEYNSPFISSGCLSLFLKVCIFIFLFEFLQLAFNQLSRKFAFLLIGKFFHVPLDFITWSFYFTIGIF